MVRSALRRTAAAVGLIALLVPAVGAVFDEPVHGDPALDAVIIGDSLTGGNVSYLRPTLAASGLRVRLEGLSARRIAQSFSFRGYRDSGIERVRTLHAEGVEARLWVVQLGTNDLASIMNCRCAEPTAFAGELIDQLLVEIGTDTPIAWVTVVDRTRWDATNAFNEALAIRAATNPYFALISWSDLAASRPDWFDDHVHPTFTGLAAFTQMYIDGIRTLLADPLGPRPPGDGLQPAVRLGPP